MNTPWTNRLLALFLLLLIVAGLAYGVSQIIKAQNQKYDAAIESRTHLIVGYRRVAANRAVLEAAIAKAGKLDTARYYLKNSIPSLAAAEIQERIQAILDANGAKASSVNIAPHKDEHGRRKISVNVNIRGTPEAIQKVLYALEGNVPYLFIENLAIRGSVTNRRWQPTPLVEPDVFVQFDLCGFAQIGVKKP
jgi:Tfp pilus assembly protein PilO